jgi:hypothetical protein
MPRPDAFAPILGTTFVKKQHETVLTIGDQHFDKFTLTQKLHCSGSYQAARLLSAALEQIGVRTAKDARTLDVALLAKMRGVGVTTLYIMLAWQETAGAGDAVKWYGKHPSFHAVQRQVRKRDAVPRPRAKTRSGPAKNTTVPRAIAK